MTPTRAGLQAFVWTARLTLRQALSSHVAWIPITLAVGLVALCLSARVAGPPAFEPFSTPTESQLDPSGSLPDPVRPGQLRLAFGAIRLGGFPDAPSAARFLRVILARAASGGVGVLLLVLATAGLIPEALRHDSAPAFLVHPTPRWLFLCGKVAGACLFATLLATLLIGGTWLALGISTADWSRGYLLCLPLLLTQFGVTFAAAVLLGVWTRNPLATSLGTFGFWGAGMIANYAHLAASTEITTPLPGCPLLKHASQFAYWLLPKPADFMNLIDRAIQSAQHVSTQAETLSPLQLGGFSPALSVLTSTLVAVALMALAARELKSLEF